MACYKVVFTLFISTFLIGIATAVFKSCSDNSVVSKVTCNDQEDNCILKRGESAKLEVDFTPKVSAKELTSVCHGIIGGIPIPFNSIDKKGCDGMKPACPVQENQSYTFTTAIPVKSEYPQLKLVVKWQEQDDKGNDVFCIIIPATIQ